MVAQNRVSHNPVDMSDALRALRLQLEWGADEAIGEAALDRFVRAHPTSPAPVIAPARPRAAPAPSGRTVDDLMAELAAFEGCALRTTAMQLVRPDGNPSAPVMVIGDAPSSEDDRSGRAFSGPAGQLLDRVLGTIGMSRDSVLLATLAPWRPPGNRRLSDAEVSQCLPFMQRLLGIVRPRCLVLLGSQTVLALSGESAPIRRLRGRWLEVQVLNEQMTIAAIALPPLDQWLVNAAAKQQLWSDLVSLRLAVTTA